MTPTPAPSGHTPPTDIERLAELARASKQAQATYKAAPTDANFHAWSAAVAAVLDAEDDVIRGMAQAGWEHLPVRGQK